LKYKIVAISLLVALTGWIIPAKTVSQTKPLVFSQEKQTALQKESVIYKTDAPIQPVGNPQQIVRSKPVVEPRPSTALRSQSNTSSKSRRDYPAPTADKEAVKALIIKYSQQYRINPEVPLCIAYYESGYNSQSKNKSSSASGVFQYLSGTWKGTDEGKYGLSVFDAEANVKAAVKYMASRKSTQPWEVRNKCPKL
jgi:hypothetical protein